MLKFVMLYLYSPIDENMIRVFKEFLDISRDELDFIYTLQKFQKDIHSIPHPSRYKKRNLFFCNLVQESAHFKKLNALFDFYLAPNPSQATWSENWSYFCHWTSLHVFKHYRKYISAWYLFGSAYLIYLIAPMVWAKSVCGHSYQFQNLTHNGLCLNPNEFVLNNSLTIYGSSNHFFTELLCRNCDNGHFYFDKNSIYGPIIGTLRDDYKTTKYYNGKFFKKYISDEEAINALKQIRAIYSQIEKGEISYSLFSFSCMDFTQMIYQAAGGKEDLYKEFTQQRLSGLTGAWATLKYNRFHYKFWLSALTVLWQMPSIQEEIDQFEEQLISCMDKKSENDDLIYCQQTPSGEKYPEGYQPSYQPTAEFQDGNINYLCRP
ncbi:hypothetical protein [Legionella jordanis]|nr:hypothetical protein [Legionella jordanis]HAT8715404.1 hypothetical protein [Legionella jordanis]